MFFESPEEILGIAKRSGCAIFVMPDDVEITIKNAIILAPEDKTTITIEQVRGLIDKMKLKQRSDSYILIRPADKMGPDAANALLKSLEEPGDKVHFVLVTNMPSVILPTILSRAAIYFLRNHEPVDGDIKADPAVKELAKKLIVAKPSELVPLVEKICKKKEGVRKYALEVLGVAIEMLYKSYFKTDKEVFIKKIPVFLKAYENIEKNGHVKLHLVADLI